MGIPGCAGLPDGSLCPNKTRSESRLHDEDGESFCDSCLRSHRLRKRNSVRSETPTGINQNQNDDPDENSSSEGSRPAAPSDVIFDPLLAYVAYARVSGTNDMIRNAVISTFTSEQIASAKNAIWRQSLHDVIGPLPKRRLTSMRSIAEANVQDILDALQKLDRADRLPSIAILSTELGAIPKAHPEEVLPISMADRMNKLEHRMTELMDVVERVVSENAQLRDGVNIGHSTAEPRQDGARVPPPPSHPSTTLPVTGKKSKKKKAGKQPDMPGAATLRGALLEPNLLEHVQLARSSSSSPPDSDSDDDPFIEVKHKKDRNKKVQITVRRTERKPLVTGSANAGFKSLCGAEPNRHLYIYGVAEGTTEEDLRDWITSELKANLKHLEKVPPSVNRPPGATSQSFHATVSLRDYDILCKPESWPEGISVRRFYPARSKART